MTKKIFKYNNNQQANTVLFIHGLGCSSLYFDDIIGYMNGKYNTLCIDLIGHGNNHDIVLNSISDQIEQIIKIIDNEGIVIDNIVAHSMGSIIAFELDIILNLKKIILFDGNLFEDDFVWSVEISNKSFSNFEEYWDNFISKYKTFLRFNTIQKLTDYQIFANDIKYTNKRNIYNWAHILAKRKKTIDFYSNSLHKTFLLESIEKNYYNKKASFCNAYNIPIFPIKDAKHFFLIEKPEEISNTIVKLLNN